MLRRRPRSAASLTAALDVTSQTSEVAVPPSESMNSCVVGEALLVDVEQRELRAGLREPGRDRLAEAAGGAGDDRDAALEVEEVARVARAG